MLSRIAIFIGLVFALGGCGQAETPPPTVDEVHTMLKSTDPDTIAQGAGWIRHYGAKAGETAPTLVNLLKHSNKTVRRNAATALGQLAGKAPEANAAIPALTNALGDSDYDVRRTAADALGEFGSAAASAIPALERCGKQPDPCGSANSAIKKIRS